MKFTPSHVDGVWEIALEPVVDHRGFFARAWCEEEFARHGLVADWKQQNLQRSPEAGTMRGLHYQIPPHSEVKLVRCTRGSVFDVAVDLRPYSPTYLQWTGTELRSDSQNAVWVPRGFAHGYVTLEPDSEVFYLTSASYHPPSVRGVRYDDPAFRINWPRRIERVPADYDNWPWFGDEQGREMAPLADLNDSPDAANAPGATQLPKEAQ
jgi:dTDP-4-dehydrorhamnose 3,5-epimerase